MTVLCSILCKCKVLTQRLTAKFLLHPQLGGTSGVSECTHVLYVHCTFILWSARALTSLYRQYRHRQNHCQKLASWPIRSLKKFYNLTPEASNHPQTPPLWEAIKKKNYEILDIVRKGGGGSEPIVSVHTFCVHTIRGSSEFWTMSKIL